MKNNKKSKYIQKLFSILLVVGILTSAMLESGLLSLLVGAADPASAFSDWKTDGWTIQEEDGEAVLKNPGVGVELIYSKNTVNSATLEFDLYVDAVNSAVDGNIGIAYKAPSGNQFFFEYNSVYKFVRIGLWVGGAYQQLSDGYSIDLGTGSWHHYDISLEENHITWSINGEQIFELNDTQGEQLVGGEVLLQGYYTSIRLKNINLENSDGGSDDPDEPGDSGETGKDLDFADWTTDGWTVVEENGEAVVKNTGTGVELIYAKKALNTAYMELDLYVDSVNSGVDGNIGVAYTAPSGNQFFFEYNSVYKFTRIGYWVEGVYQQLSDGYAMELSAGSWHHYTIVFEEDHLRWFIDDQLVCEVKDTLDEKMTGGSLCIQGYYTSIRVKNIRTYNSLAASFPEWNTDGWERSEVEGHHVLIGSAGVGLMALTTKEAISLNCLEFGVRIQSVNSSIDGNIGAAYQFEGKQYFFAYNTVHKCYLLYRSTEAGMAQLGAVAGELVPDQWHTFRIVMNDDHLEWYVNGDSIMTIDDTYGDVLASGTWLLQTYANDIQLRNLAFSNVVPTDRPACKDCDFEFTSPSSVEQFEATGGSVSYENGALVYKVEQANSSLISPVIGAEVGTAYSAKMNVKNTIMLRLKNDTDASQIKVYFKTDKILRYSEENSATVSVVPHGGYQTVFVNFSACPGAGASYLKTFKLIPVGATSGTITIDAITFEREKAFYDYAGEILSCTADGKTVTVKGRLNSEFAGKTVKLYELLISNYTESVDGLTPIAEAVADGESFTITLPFMDGNVSHLPSLFMATVDGVKISDRFMVENYRDFTENPYAFTLPGLTVDVTESRFGAKGDGFTNDNAAIQKAIDYVNAQGGGTVVIPGDDSEYGRRFVATNLLLKSNVELRIEEGAILWQSPRVEDYAYDVIRGHDVEIPGINWTHAFLCHNYPLIQAYEAENIRITGGGTVRMVDTGGENLDGVDGGTIWTGCASRIHIIPFGMYACTNVEISDITVLRASSYHASLFACENVYIANFICKEPVCASGDGIGFGSGTNHVLLERFVIFSNDDAVTFCPTYNEPRGLTWWKARPEADNSVHHILVKSSNIFSGHGITFLPWGTDNPDLSKQEIKHIEVTDCILYGPYSIGAWPDNPYFGGSFTNTETNDFSPVRDVYIHDNDYLSKCTLECIKGTNIITDCGITSNSQFLHGNFERRVRNQKGWIAGLSNWGYELGEGSTVVAAEVDGGHAGKLTGTGKLYQGLYLSSGSHRMTMDTNLISGGGVLFARDALTGELLASVAIPAGKQEEVALVFVLTRATTVALGVELTEAGEVFVDNASVKSKGFTTSTDYRDRFMEDFEILIDPAFDYTGRFTVTQENKNNFASAAASVGTAVQTLLSADAVSFDMRYHLRITDVASVVDGNVGIAYGYNDGYNCYFLEFNIVNQFLRLRKFVGGTETELIAPTSYTFKTHEWMQIGLRVKDGKAEIYIDGQLVASGEDSGTVGWCVAFSDYNIGYDIDNLTIADVGTLDMTELVSVEPSVKEYVLYFLVDEGAPVPAPQVLTEGAAMTAVEAPVRDGYTFLGWLADGELIDMNTFRMPAANVILTAAWEDTEKETTDPGEETTSEPEPDTNEPDTSDKDPETGDVSSEPDTGSETDKIEKPRKGCRSVIPSLGLMTVLISVAWISLKRKKEV